MKALRERTRWHVLAPRLGKRSASGRQQDACLGSPIPLHPLPPLSRFACACGCRAKPKAPSRRWFSPGARACVEVVDATHESACTAYRPIISIHATLEPACSLRVCVYKGAKPHRAHRACHELSAPRPLVRATWERRGFRVECRPYILDFEHSCMGGRLGAHEGPRAACCLGCNLRTTIQP